MAYTFYIGTTAKATSLEVTPKHFDSTKSTYYSDSTSTGTLRDAAGGNLDSTLTAFNFSTTPSLNVVSYGVGKFVSPPLTTPSLASGAITPTIAFKSTVATNETFDVYISAYVTVGSTDVIRGVILQPTSYVNWLTAITAGSTYTVTTSSLTGSAVTMTAGDRIVFEIAVRRVAAGNGSFSTLTLESANFVMNGLTFGTLTSEIKTIYQTIEGTSGATIDPFTNTGNPFSYVTTNKPTLISTPTPVAVGSTVSMRAPVASTSDIGFTTANWSTDIYNGYSGYFFFQILPSNFPANTLALIQLGGIHNGNLHLQYISGGQYDFRAFAGAVGTAVSGSPSFLVENVWYRCEWSCYNTGTLQGNVYLGTSNTLVSSASTGTGASISNSAIPSYVRMSGLVNFPNCAFDQFVMRNEKTTTFPLYGTTNFPATFSTVVSKNGTFLYDAYSVVSNNASLAFNTLTVANKDGSILYNVPVVASTSAILSYDDMVVVTRPGTVLYNDYAAVGTGKTIKYDALKSVGVQDDLRYNVLGLVNKQTTLQYNSLLKVVDSFVIVYDIQQSTIRIWTGSQWVGPDSFKIWSGSEWVGFDKLSVYQDGHWILGRT